MYSLRYQVNNPCVSINRAGKGLAILIASDLQTRCGRLEMHAACQYIPVPKYKGEVVQLAYAVGVGIAEARVPWSTQRGARSSPPLRTSPDGEPVRTCPGRGMKVYDAEDIEDEF